MIKETYDINYYAKEGKKKVFEHCWVSEDIKDIEYSIIREVYIEEGNTCWTYEPLVSGFTSELEAEKYIQSIFKEEL